MHGFIDRRRWRVPKSRYVAEQELGVKNDIYREQAHGARRQAKVKRPNSAWELRTSPEHCQDALKIYKNKGKGKDQDCFRALPAAAN